MSKSLKVSGVWMDQKHAYVIASPDKSASGDFDIFAEVKCEDHDDDAYKNEKVNQSKETQELKKYFKEIASFIDDVQSIYIFGPGQAQEQFKNFLKDYQNFDEKEIKLGTSDKISENQMIAKTKAFFNEE